MKKLIKSFKYAFEGIFTGFKQEQNMKIHVIIMKINMVGVYNLIFRKKKMENGRI